MNHRAALTAAATLHAILKKMRTENDNKQMKMETNNLPLWPKNTLFTRAAASARLVSSTSRRRHLMQFITQEFNKYGIEMCSKPHRCAGQAALPRAFNEVGLPNLFSSEIKRGKIAINRPL